MTLSNTEDLLGPRALSLNGLRVLLVEDSWQVSEALKRLLETCGADVVGPVATTAGAAHLSSGQTIDVALVDINLRDGELAYGLIDQLQDQGIRIVVMTGYYDVALKQGRVATVLRKPVEPEVLLKSLRPE